MLGRIKRLLKWGIALIILLFSLYVIFLLNPSLSYTHQTNFGQVTVYHNQPLEKATHKILSDALDIIRTSNLYDSTIHIQLCLNDDAYYPKLHPLSNGIAYSFLNKSIINYSTPNFSKNISAYSWEINDYEERHVNLIWLLAHEFTHNLQFNWKWWFQLESEFWQQEGYAEYISRKWKNDGQLLDKINVLLKENAKSHKGIPTFLMEDSTIQLLSYCLFNCTFYTPLDLRFTKQHRL